MLQASAATERTEEEQRMQELYRKLQEELAQLRASMHEATSQAVGEKEARLRAIETRCYDLEARANVLQTGLPATGQASRLMAEQLQATREREAMLHNVQQLKASEEKNRELQIQLSQQQGATKKAVENVSSWISKLEVHLARSEELMLDAIANAAEPDGEKHRKATEAWNRELQEQLAQQPEATAAEVEGVTAKIAAFGVKMANQLKTMQEALARSRDESKLRLRENQARSKSIQDKLTQQRDTMTSEAKEAAKRTAQLENLLSKQRETATESAAMALSASEERLQSQDALNQELQAQLSQLREKSATEVRNAQARISELEVQLLKQRGEGDVLNQELQGQLSQLREKSATEVRNAQARISELEVQLLKQRGEADHALAKVRLAEDDKVQASECRIHALHSELERQRDAAAAAENDAAERMSALRVQLGRQQGDMEHAMAKAETVGDLLHASDTRNRVLQAQLADQQQVTSAENKRAVSQISELETRILECESSARQMLSEARREAQQRLDIAEAKCTELQSQLTAIRGGHAVETENSTRRVTMLESQLAEQQRALQEALVRSDERFQASEGRARELLDQAGKKQEALQIAAAREAAASEQELQKSHAARQVLETQLAEARGTAATETRCLQDQCQEALKEVKRVLSRTSELEARIETLQEARLDVEQRLVQSQAAKQELEIQLATHGAREANELHRQRMELEQFQVAKEDLEAKLAAQKKHEASQIHKQRIENEELEASKTDLESRLSAQRKTEASQAQRNRAENDELEAAKADLEAKLATQRKLEASQAQKQRLENDELEAAQQQLAVELAAQRKAAAAQAQKQRGENDEMEARARSLEAALEAQQRQATTEAVASQAKLDRGKHELSEFRSKDEENQAQIGKLETKLRKLRAACDVSVNAARSYSHEIEEEATIATTRLGDVRGSSSKPWW